MNDTIILKLKLREDGGLRVSSDHIPGLMLSGADPAAVIADIWPALEVITARLLEADNIGLS